MDIVVSNSYFSKCFDVQDINIYLFISPGGLHQAVFFITTNELTLVIELKKFAFIKHKFKHFKQDTQQANIQLV